MAEKTEHELEQELVKNALDGDSAAMTEIVHQHQANVFNLALKLVGTEEEAECVLQDTFLKVFEKLKDFRLESRLGTWIHRIATNAALMRLRKRKGKYFHQIQEEPGEDDNYDLGYIVESLERDALSIVINEELGAKLQEAINMLPVQQRTAFVLKDLEGYSLAEIAEETGKSIAAVKADLHRSRLKLRSQLAEFVREDA